MGGEENEKEKGNEKSEDGKPPPKPTVTSSSPPSSSTSSSSSTTESTTSSPSKASLAVATAAQQQQETLKRKLMFVRYCRAKTIRVLNIIIPSIFLSFIVLLMVFALLQIRFLLYQHHNAYITLSEPVGDFYLYHSGNVWYKFPIQSQGLFEISEGHLKVNTSLYAW